MNTQYEHRWRKGRRQSDQTRAGPAGRERGDQFRSPEDDRGSGPKSLRSMQASGRAHV